jgi:hypothetical protein
MKCKHNEQTAKGQDAVVYAMGQTEPSTCKTKYESTSPMYVYASSRARRRCDSDMTASSTVSIASAFHSEATPYPESETESLAESLDGDEKMQWLSDISQHSLSTDSSSQKLFRFDIDNGNKDYRYDDDVDDDDDEEVEEAWFFPTPSQESDSFESDVRTRHRTNVSNRRQHQDVPWSPPSHHNHRATSSPTHDYLTTTPQMVILVPVPRRAKSIPPLFQKVRSREKLARKQRTQACRTHDLEKQSDAVPARFQSNSPTAGGKLSNDDEYNPSMFHIALIKFTSLLSCNMKS